MANGRNGSKAATQLMSAMGGKRTFGWVWYTCLQSHLNVKNRAALASSNTNKTVETPKRK
jgi:hypothetical protein